MPLAIDQHEIRLWNKFNMTPECQAIYEVWQMSIAMCVLSVDAADARYTAELLTMWMQWKEMNRDL